MNAYNNLSDDAVEAIIQRTNQAGERIKDRMYSVQDSFIAALDEAMPVLAIPATQQECVEAVELMTQRYFQIFRTFKPSLVTVKKALVQNSNTLCDTTELLRNSWRIDDEPLREHCRLICQNASGGHIQFLKLSQTFMAGWDSPSSEMLQGILQKMVATQDDALKTWFCEKFLGTSQHEKVTFSKPIVTVQDKTNNFLLPPELMAMIYESADLETCVSLRQASSQWFSIFNKLDFLWKPKVQARNPLLSPNSECFSSWQDCVLVFVARLKWAHADCLGEVTTNNQDPKHNPLLAVPLGFQEKLPTNFTAMGQHGLGCKSLACEHIHIDDELEVNPWTLETDTINQDFDRVSEYAVRCKGIEISFSGDLPDFVPKDPLDWSYQVISTYITIYFPNEKAIVMTRDKPNFKDGIYFDSFASFGEVGETYYYQREGVLYFADFGSQRMIQCSSTGMYSGGEPTAVYNGLVWLTKKSFYESYLIPTFQDLQTPDRLYYKPEKVIVSRKSVNGYEQGSRSRNCSHLLVSLAEDSWTLVNLETGVVTDIVPHSGIDYAPAQIYPGYLNGKFVAYFLDDGFEKTREMVLERERPVAHWGEELEGREVVV